jgi:dTDP-4-amino-4,6-dideoxygalactose transaminase/RimJ/RimL family protein N-acetyltransferase
VSEPVRLRDANASDEAILLEWANDPEVRRASFNSAPIDAATHARWYKARLQDPQAAFFIAEVGGERVGYGRVDPWSPDTAEIAVSIAAEARGRGLGRQLIALTAEEGARRLGVRRVLARVKTDNQASVRAFVAAGFQPLDGAGEQVALVWPQPPLVPHSRPFVGEREAAAAAAVVRSRALAGGAVVRALEAEWCRRTGMSAAACAASGVGALRLSLWALGVGPGDEVIMPAYSCVALLNAALVLGGRPILADVVPGEWTLDPADTAARMTPRTRAIIAVNLFGMPARLAELRALGVPVVEDCAHGIGGITGAGPFGGGGDVSIGSFYATKMIAGGEGGILAARDPELVERARGARDYGDQLPGAQNLNDKLTDIEGAIVLEQLAQLEAMLDAREARAARYDDLLAGLGVELPARAPGRIWYRYAVRLERGNAVELAERIAPTGVRVEAPVWDLRAAPQWGPGLDHTADAFERVLSLPLYPDLSPGEQELVVERLAAAL